MNSFFYKQPVPIDFGYGKLKRLPEILDTLNGSKGLLISAPSMVRSGIAAWVMAHSHGRLVAMFSDIKPNPTVKDTDACANELRNHQCDFAIALGGGSVMDCAKAACFVVKKPYSSAEYLAGNKKIDEPGIPLIAIPTTSGTASEVTPVSVLTDTKRGVKAGLSSDYLFPVFALVDPELTVSCPPQVTAASGMDVLAHSLEAFYGKKHQPLTDLAAERAAKLVLENLLIAYHEPENAEARSNMSEASFTAGLAFSITQTAAAHACSYPLTQEYGVVHGDACAFTLPTFWKLNSSEGPEEDRLQRFSKRLGFQDSTALANHIDQMKVEMKMPLTLADAGIPIDDLDKLVNKSFAPNMKNNPVTITKERLKSIYLHLNKHPLFQ